MQHLPLLPSGRTPHDACRNMLPELLLPFSYSHLLFKLTLLRLPFAGLGLGLSGPLPKMDPPLTLPIIGLDDPKDDRRAP